MVYVVFIAEARPIGTDQSLDLKLRMGGQVIMGAKIMGGGGEFYEGGSLSTYGGPPFSV